MPGGGDSDVVALDFTAIDFETANSSNASACAVGLARVRDGRVVETASWLIRPPAGHDAFLSFNIGIHGIRAADVTGAPTWTEQLVDLAAFAGDDVLVAHNAGFDMAVLRTACEVTGSAHAAYRYLCSLQVARRTYDLPSYRLPLVAAEAGYGAFAHHDALADALACAHIVVDAAGRAGADDLDALASLAGVRISALRVPEPVGMLAVA
jgi:DNA polymerase III subunit epsilon